MKEERSNKGVYIVITESNSGKSMVSLGLIDSLKNRGLKVGFFRPVIDDYEKQKIDNHINTVLTYFNLDISYNECYAFTRSELMRLKNEDRDEEIISKILAKYKKLEERFDFVVVEGTSFKGEGAMIEFDVNVIIAKNLGIPAIFVGCGVNKTIEEYVGNMLIAFDAFRDKKVEIISVLTNKVQQKNKEWVEAELKKLVSSDVTVGVIPMNSSLANPSIKEIVEELEAKVLFGKEYINNQAGSYGVGAMQLRNYLNHLKENSLVITPGDRADIILGALQANISSNYPSVSGIVLTGGLIPEDTIIKLIEGLSEVVPIISVQGGTFSVTNRIGNIKSQIYAENTEKIKLSIKDFVKNVPVEPLLNRILEFKSNVMTPGMFQYKLLNMARKESKTIVLPEGTDARILEAAESLIVDDAVALILLGDSTTIKDKAKSLNIHLDETKISIIDPKHFSRRDEYAAQLYELRKHKNLTLEKAHELLDDVSYFGTMMVYMGDADGMVSGAIHTTQETIRPALQIIKTSPGLSLISSVFFMCLEDRVSVYGDCAINPNPTAEQLAQIAISSATTSRAFGIDPKIAMLSYSSGSSGIGEDVEKVRKATDIVKTQEPSLQVEGPIQYDAAVDISVGKIKMPESNVAGQANVFIFPDLNTGNNTYKAVQRETQSLAIGPIIQGLKKPVNDLSRGCTVDDIINTVLVTAIQAID